MGLGFGLELDGLAVDTYVLHFVTLGGLALN